MALKAGYISQVGRTSPTAVVDKLHACQLQSLAGYPTQSMVGRMLLQRALSVGSCSALLLSYCCLKDSVES
jgi:hypothetical protein